MLHNILGPVFDSTLDQFLTRPFWHFFGVLFSVSNAVRVFSIAGGAPASRKGHENPPILPPISLLVGPGKSHKDRPRVRSCFECNDSEPRKSHENYTKSPRRIARNQLGWIPQRNTPGPSPTGPGPSLNTPMGQALWDQVPLWAGVIPRGDTCMRGGLW